MDIAAPQTTNYFDRIDGRVKTCVLLGAILITGMFTRWEIVAIQIVATVIVAMALRISWRRLLHRLVIPLGFAWVVFAIMLFTHGHQIIGRVNLYFTVLPIYREGLALGILMYLRITAMVTLASILSFCTPMPEILDTLRGLKMPDIIVDLAEMIYRYIFVLHETMLTMRKAQLSRGSAERPWLLKIHDLGMLAANVLIKALDRSTQVYKAMASRGYDENSVNPPYFTYAVPQSDIYIGIVAAVGLLSLLIANFH